MEKYIIKNDKLTAAEVAEMFNYKESTITNSFKRTAAAIKKKHNVDLLKCENSNGEIYYQIIEETRALTIYNQIEDIPITLESLSYEAYQFYVFLAIVASPFSAYRGKREDLLKYIGIKVNKKNIETLNQVLNSLVNKNRIGFQQDGDFIIVYLRGDIENQYSISVNMLRESQKIADENHKNFNKIPQLVQVWEAVKICYEHQPFTYAQISKMTGLSYKQIRDVKKLLEKNDIFKTSRAGSYFLSKGLNVDLNAFFN